MVAEPSKSKPHQVQGHQALSGNPKVVTGDDIAHYKLKVHWLPQFEIGFNIIIVFRK